MCDCLIQFSKTGSLILIENGKIKRRLENFNLIFSVTGWGTLVLGNWEWWVSGWSVSANSESFFLFIILWLLGNGESNYSGGSWVWKNGVGIKKLRTGGWIPNSPFHWLWIIYLFTLGLFCLWSNWVKLSCCVCVVVMGSNFRVSWFQQCGNHHEGVLE